MKTIVVFSVVIISCLAQRPYYAGRPPTLDTAPSTGSGLGDRFGEGAGTTTTIRLPLEALGDAELVKRLSKLPIDQQPFWLINWKALEENRNHPQSYPQERNSFVDDSSNFNLL